MRKCEGHSRCTDPPSDTGKVSSEQGGLQRANHEPGEGTLNSPHDKRCGVQIVTIIGWKSRRKVEEKADDNESPIEASQVTNYRVPLG
jgi:hypothetical protein